MREKQHEKTAASLFCHEAQADLRKEGTRMPEHEGHSIAPRICADLPDMVDSAIKYDKIS